VIQTVDKNEEQRRRKRAERFGLKSPAVEEPKDRERSRSQRPVSERAVSGSHCRGRKRAASCSGDSPLPVRGRGRVEPAWKSRQRLEEKGPEDLPDVPDAGVGTAGAEDDNIVPEAVVEGDPQDLPDLPDAGVGTAGVEDDNTVKVPEGIVEGDPQDLPLAGVGTAGAQDGDVRDPEETPGAPGPGDGVLGEQVRVVVTVPLKVKAAASETIADLRRKLHGKGMVGGAFTAGHGPIQEMTPCGELRGVRLAISESFPWRAQAQAQRFARPPTPFEASQHPFYKTKMCHLWAQGHCLRGQRCLYAHGAAEMRKRAQAGVNSFNPFMQPMWPQFAPGFRPPGFPCGPFPPVSKGEEAIGGLEDQIEDYLLEMQQQFLPPMFSNEMALFDVAEMNAELPSVSAQSSPLCGPEGTDVVVTGPAVGTGDVESCVLQHDSVDHGELAVQNVTVQHEVSSFPSVEKGETEAVSLTQSSPGVEHEVQCHEDGPSVEVHAYRENGAEEKGTIHEHVCPDAVEGSIVQEGAVVEQARAPRPEVPQEAADAQETRVPRAAAVQEGAGAEQSITTLRTAVAQQGDHNEEFREPRAASARGAVDHKQTPTPRAEIAQGVHDEQIRIPHFDHYEEPQSVQACVPDGEHMTEAHDGFAAGSSRHLECSSACTEATSLSKKTHSDTSHEEPALVLHPSSPSVPDTSAPEHHPLAAFDTRDACAVRPLQLE